jgi:hypothetical protein
MIGTLGSHHVCVHCGFPTVSLYRILSGSNIKLMECSNCHEDVDPYIEREMLLVVIDWVLLRRPAYRHVIFNRPIHDYVIPSLGCIVFFYTILRLVGDATHHATTTYWTVHVMDLVCTCLRVILQWTLITLGIGTAAIVVIRRDKRDLQLKNTKQIYMKILKSIAVAILAPCLFSVLTAFIHIYEPSSTIRNLGILYTTISQVVAADIVIRCYRIYFTLQSVSTITMDIKST